MQERKITRGKELGLGSPLKVSGQPKKKAPTQQGEQGKQDCKAPQSEKPEHRTARRPKARNDYAHHTHTHTTHTPHTTHTHTHTTHTHTHHTHHTHTHHTHHTHNTQKKNIHTFTPFKEARMPYAKLYLFKQVAAQLLGLKVAPGIKPPVARASKGRLGHEFGRPRNSLMFYKQNLDFWGRTSAGQKIPIEIISKPLAVWPFVILAPGIKFCWKRPTWDLNPIWLRPVMLNGRAHIP